MQLFNNCFSHADWKQGRTGGLARHQRDPASRGLGPPALLEEPSLRVAGVRTLERPDFQGVWGMFQGGDNSSQYPLLKKGETSCPCNDLFKASHAAFPGLPLPTQLHLSCRAPPQGHHDHNKLWKQVESSVQIAGCQQRADEGPLLARWYRRGSGGVSRSPAAQFPSPCSS